MRTADLQRHLAPASLQGTATAAVLCIRNHSALETGPTIVSKLWAQFGKPLITSKPVEELERRVCLPEV